MEQTTSGETAFNGVKTGPFPRLFILFVSVRRHARHFFILHGLPLLLLLLFIHTCVGAHVCMHGFLFLFSYNQMSAVPKTVVARWNPGCRRSHVFSAYYVQKYKPKNKTRNSYTNLLQRGLPRVIIDSSVSTRRGVAVDGRRQIDLADGKHVKWSLKIVLKNPRLTDGFA